MDRIEKWKQTNRIKYRLSVLEIIQVWLLGRVILGW